MPSPSLPFAAIVLTARPNPQKAHLRIGRIHELRFDDTEHGESWPAHEVFWGEQGMGVGGDVVEEKKQADAETLREFLCNRTEVP
jgi:hypothetical protein